MYITGGVVNKDNPLYFESTRDFNLAHRKFPCIMVFCFSEDDVINALKYAVSEDIHFRVRSGRNDYEGNSNVDEGMVIDISNINYSYIDEIDKKAKFGAGIIDGKMYSDLANRGYTIASGSCNNVGFCAQTTCGGIGFASRLLGLSCDNLLEIELINYEGKKIVANEYCNENLFWAVRGGLAASFGVVVSLTYRITPVCKVSTYAITWNSKYFIDVVDTWQRLIPSADVRLTDNVILEKKPSGEIILASRGQFFGGKEELERIIEPLIKAAPTECIEIETVPYKQALKTWSSVCPNNRKFKATGSFIYKPISKGVLKCLEDKMMSAPKNCRQFYDFKGLGGNVSKIKPDETAFVHRNSLYLIEVGATWDLEIDRKDNIAWTNSVKGLLDTVGRGTYRGFTDFDIADWQWQYYGENYLRLREVKTQYDPQNIFNFPQSIEPL